MVALICPVCAGPLPSEALEAAHTTCGYCSVVVSRDVHEFRAVDASTARPTSDAIRTRLQTFNERVAQGLRTDGDPREVLQGALREHLECDSEAEVVTAVALGLAAELRESHGMDVTRDPNVLARLAEGYLRACDALREGGSAELNLPFLTANAQGPIHFVRRVTVADIRAFARGERAPSKTAGGPNEQPKKKNWWWPF